ncbi:hypothetical protein TD95_002151 [Thielaviopsis punctulata]|uniref:Inosine triphosphate pyrophosphatase n=1 Tax=Thielaviopsis punctulata TaxID=72032 RepID=A0A0F4Z7Y3_9PEZI|nr:hypothetical protein TD95_002151 [Thielaviopsis punctulata]
MAPVLNFITGNANKLREVKLVLEPAIQVTNQAIDLEEVQGTLEEVTIAKARKAADITKKTQKVGGPVLVEDTSLCFNALNGLPGPYIKWFFQSIGFDGLNNMLVAYQDKGAEAVCTFGYCEGPGKDVVLFQGRTAGKFVQPRGPTNFGWDAGFEYEGRTYAEMKKEEKNTISHRGKALKKLQAWFNEQNAASS